MCRNVSSVIEHTFTLHQVSDTVGTRRAELEVQSFHHHHSTGLTLLNSLWLVGVIVSIQKKKTVIRTSFPASKTLFATLQDPTCTRANVPFPRIGAYPLSLACFLPLMMFAVVHPTHPRTPSPHKFKCIYSQAQPGPSAA